MKEREEGVRVYRVYRVLHVARRQYRHCQRPLFSIQIFQVGGNDSIDLEAPKPVSTHFEEHHTLRYLSHELHHRHCVMLISLDLPPHLIPTYLPTYLPIFSSLLGCDASLVPLWL